MWREFWYHRNLQVFNGVFKSGGCFSPHKSVCLLIRFGYFLLVLVCVCLGFFTLWTTWTLVKHTVTLHVRCEVKSMSLT